MDLTPDPFPNPGIEHPGCFAREGEKTRETPPSALGKAVRPKFISTGGEIEEFIRRPDERPVDKEFINYQRGVGRQPERQSWGLGLNLIEIKTR